jgi:flagellar motor protein MotB
MMNRDDGFEQQVEDENYFVSMTDMMVGLVFIFIILIMYYALQLQQVRDVFQNTTEQLTSANQTRTEILHDIQDRLRRQGLKVEIDTRNGVLRLPDEVLFDSAKAEVKPAGVVALHKLGLALEAILPCYTDRPSGLQGPANCKPSQHRIESLFIEGHTDKDKLASGGRFKDNWDLSAERATNTYRQLISQYPDLTTLCLQHTRGACVPIFSVSGYGDQRPVVTGDSLEAKARNRRIDLRILMQTPHASEAQEALRIRLGEEQ